MKRPNILILYTDQQRWDAVGANGNHDIQTPAMDRLAADGVNLDHCFVQNPVCMPSRVSMLTGRYPSALGITHMAVPVPPDTLTLPRMLRNYGYYSGNTGKLHFLPHANRDHSEVHPGYGFDQLEISDEPGCYPDAYRAWVERRAPEQLDRVSLGLPAAARTWRELMGIGEAIVHPAERFPKKALAFQGSSDLTHGAFVAEQAIEFIRTHRHRPWLQIASFYSPHSPWVAPHEFLDRYDPVTLTLPTFPPEVEAQRSETSFSDAELRAARHGYYAMVSEVDSHIGRILAYLDELDLAENTIVVLISDHGEWLGEHLRYGKGYPGDDCVARVPLIVRWPAGIGKLGQTISALVEAVDVVPTLLSACGIPVPSAVQGRSLLPLIAGEVAQVRRSALMESTGWRALRTEQFRYLCGQDGAESLFDLRADPQEYTDVAADPAYAQELSELRAALLQRVIAAEQPMPRVWPY